MKGLWYILPAVIAMGLIFTISCKTAGKPETTQQVAVKTEEVQSGPIWQVEWDKLIQAAKKEGRVTIYGSMETRQRIGIQESFRKKFGMEAEIISGRSDEISTRLFQERRAGLFTADAYLEGPTGPLQELIPGGVLERLDKVLFLPEVVDEKNWRYFNGVFYDKNHFLAGGFTNVMPTITINTKMVRIGEIKNLEDLLDPKWRGKIIIGDPTVGGGPQITMIGVLLAMGEDYIKKLVEQKPTITRDKRLLVEWIARERFPVGIGAWGSVSAEFVDAGAPLDYIVPDKGAVMFCTAVAGLMNQAPHPNAAKLLINWILTKEAQEMYAPLTAKASRRADVSNEWMADIYRPKTGVKYTVQDENLSMNAAKIAEPFKELFRPVME